MKSVVVLSVVVLLVMMTVTPVKAASCNQDPSIDGCTIPFGLRLPYQTTFTTACNRHDICYGCGVMYAVTKTQCDRAFLNDMRQACTLARQRGRLTVNPRITCEEMAEDVFYEAVKVFGHHFYAGRDTMEAYCLQDWVTPCLPSGNM